MSEEQKQIYKARVKYLIKEREHLDKQINHYRKLAKDE